MDERTKTRLQIDVSATELERMNTVMNMTDIGTRKELFNNAVSLFYWAATVAAKGQEIAAVAADGSITVLTMPALQNAALYGVQSDVDHVLRSMESAIEEQPSEPAAQDAVVRRPREARA